MNTPLFMRKIDKYGYSLVSSGLITSFTAGPYPPSASESDQTGVILQFDVPTSTSSQTIRLFRGRTLLGALQSSEIDLENTQIMIDTGAPFGQTIEYHLEVFRYDDTPKYQYMTIGYTTPNVQPDNPTISNITKIKDESNDTSKSIELSWNYDPQSNPSKNPTHFLVEVKSGSSTIFNRKYDFYQYRYTYEKTISFNVDSSTTSVDVYVKSVRGSLNGSDSQSISINQFNLLPAPEISIDNLTTKFEYNEMEIPIFSYSFDITFSMPSGVGSIDYFHIVPTSSSVFSEPTDQTPTANSFTFTEDNIPITSFPNYIVKAVRGTSESPEAIKQFSISDIPNIVSDIDEARSIMQSFVEKQEKHNSVTDVSFNLPSSLGMPVLSVYYNGSSLKDWLNNQDDDKYVPYLRKSIEDFYKTDNGNIMWKKESDSVLNFITNRSKDSRPIVSHNVTNTNFNVTIDGKNLAAQRFKWTDNPTIGTNAIEKVQLYLAYVSGPGEDIFVDIYSDQTEDGEHYPETKLNSQTGRISGNTNSNPTFRTCEFDSPVEMTYNQDYWIVVWTSPSQTTYKWFGYSSNTILDDSPDYYECLTQKSTHRILILDRDNRELFQGMSYRQALITKMSAIDSNIVLDGELVESAPSLVTDYSTIESVDTFLNKLRPELDMEESSYDGPCIIFHTRPSRNVELGFIDGDTSLISSFVRVGSNQFMYGKTTNTTRLSDVSSKINSTPGYKSVVLSEQILDGGELSINFHGIKYITGDGETTIDINDINPNNYNVDEISIDIDTSSSENHRTYDGGYLVRTSKVAGRYLENTKIRLLPPYEQSPNVPWYPRIDSGRFSVYRNDSTGSNSNVHEYSVAEFPFQNWSEKRGIPYKDIWGETPAIIDNKTLRLNRYPISDIQDIHLLVNGVVWNSKIMDIDKQNGIILLDERLPASPNIQVDYVYKENSYVYPFININPSKHMNSSIRDKYVGIFITQMYNDIPDGTSDNNDFFTGSDDQTFFGRRRTIFHRVFDTADDLKNFANSSSNSFVYLLGYYYIIDGNIENVVIKDARTQGGGIKETLSSREAIEKNRGARGFYDIGYFDGEPFSESHVLIRLPEYLKEQMDEDKIKELATKYLSYGVMPIITFYKGTRIDLSNPNSTSVFPLPENIPNNQLVGYGVEYDTIYGIK